MVEENNYNLFDGDKVSQYNLLLNEMNNLKCQINSLNSKLNEKEKDKVEYLQRENKVNIGKCFKQQCNYQPCTPSNFMKKYSYYNYAMIINVPQIKPNRTRIDFNEYNYPCLKINNSPAIKEKHPDYYAQIFMQNKNSIIYLDEINKTELYSSGGTYIEITQEEFFKAMNKTFLLLEEFLKML